MASQQELFPHQVSLSASDAELLDELLGEMNILGYHLNKLGRNTFVVVGSPADSNDTDFQSLLETILDRYKKNLVDLNIDKSINLARSLASSLSARPGQRLFLEEMTHLIGELFSCKAPEQTPDGRRIFVIIPEEHILQLMNR
jgi:DNA mismatch repair protein MutL